MRAACVNLILVSVVAFAHALRVILPKASSFSESSGSELFAVEEVPDFSPVMEVELVDERQEYDDEGRPLDDVDVHSQPQNGNGGGGSAVQNDDSPLLHTLSLVQQ